MEKENEIQTEEIEDIKDLDENNEETDWKAEALKAQGLAKRYKTKLEKAKEKKETPENKKEENLGYAEKAYLVANGIKGKEEIDLVKEYMASGKDIDTIIESKHFQNDLKDLRESIATKNAVPTNSKRSGGQSRDDVDYWLAKGELPPNTPDNQELRVKVVNAKMKAQTTGSMFSKNPVVR